MSLPKRIKAQRIKLKLTQNQLAELVGVSQGAIAHWESGRREPETIKQITDIAKALKMKPSCLMFGEEVSGDDEKELIKNYRLAGKAGKQAIISTAGAIAHTNPNGKK